MRVCSEEEWLSNSEKIQRKNDVLQVVIQGQSLFFFFFANFRENQYFSNISAYRRRRQMTVSALSVEGNGGIYGVKIIVLLTLQISLFLSKKSKSKNYFHIYRLGCPKNKLLKNIEFRFLGRMREILAVHRSKTNNRQNTAMNFRNS